MTTFVDPPRDPHRTWARVRSWLRHVFRRTAIERDLDDEVRACAEILTAERSVASLTAAEARRRALVELGGVESLKEQTRQSYAAASIHAVLRDLRYGMRILRTRRLFAATAILSIAIGIGAASAVYAWGSAMFYRDPSGVVDPARLVALFVDDNDPSTDYNILSVPHFHEIERASSHVFSSMGGATRFWATLGASGSARAATVEYVTGQFFTTVGASVALGRGLSQDDDVPGAASAAVLSDHIWRSVFGGSADVLGRTVRLSGQSFTVVGVMAPSFEGIDYSFYGPPDAWAAMAKYSLVTGSARFSGRAAALRTVARLQPGITRATAEAALAPVAASLSYEKGDYQRYSAILVLSLRDARIPSYTREAMRQYFHVLLIVAGLLVAAACVNIANFLMSQSVTRRDEMALRLALGATRPQVFQQLMTECAILGSVGGLGGVGLALLFSDLLERFPLANNLGLALTTPVVVDARIVAFAAAVCCAAVLAFGLMPAWLVSTRAPLAGRQDLGFRSTGRGFTFRQSVLGVQVALSVTLTIVAALYARSLLRIEALTYPYQTDAILLARVNPTALQVDRRKAFYLDLLQQVRQRSDVVAAGYSFNPLLSIGAMRVFASPEAPPIQADFTHVGPGFFGAVGVAFRAGRDFPEDGDKTDITIMNATLADKLWPGENPIGRTIRLPNGYGDRLTVVGIVDQPRCTDRLSGPFPCIYLPLTYARDSSETLHVRTRNAAEMLAPIVRSLAQRLNSDAVVEQTMTLRDHIGRLRLGPRVTSTMTAGIALLASALSAIGCSALLLALIRETRREMAIRLALGSAPRHLARHIMRRAMLPYVCGLAAGLAGAWYGSREIGAQLYNTSVHDPVAFLVPVLSLGAIGWAASYWPTRTAIRANVASLLRD